MSFCLQVMAWLGWIYYTFLPRLSFVCFYCYNHYIRARIYLVGLAWLGTTNDFFDTIVCYLTWLGSNCLGQLVLFIFLSPARRDNFGFFLHVVTGAHLV